MKYDINRICGICIHKKNIELLKQFKYVINFVQAFKNLKNLKIYYAQIRWIKIVNNQKWGININQFT